jgi:outer membrane protein assembly factor BamB
MCALSVAHLPRERSLNVAATTPSRSFKARGVLSLTLSVLLLAICACQSAPSANHQQRSIVVASVPGGDGSEVFVLDGQNGHLLWKHAGVGGEYIPQISGNIVYLEDTHYTKLSALDALTGATRWTSQEGLAGFTPGTAYTFDSQFNHLMALRDTDGKPLWKITISAHSDLRLFIAGDTPYLWQADAGNPDQGSVISLNPTTGAVRWRASIANEIGEVADAYNGLVFAFGGTSAGATAYALDAASGKLRWQVFFPQNAPWVGEVLPCGSNVLCLAYSDGSVTAVNSQDGHEVWHFTYGKPIPSGPFYAALSFAQDSDSLLVATPQHLAVVDIRSGKLRWQRDFIGSAALAFSGAYPFHNGVIYINAQAGQVQPATLIEAFDAVTGKIKWQVPGMDSDAGYPLLLGDKLINAPGSTVVAYNITNGSTGWQTVLPIPRNQIEFLSVALVTE